MLNFDDFTLGSKDRYYVLFLNCKKDDYVLSFEVENADKPEDMTFNASFYVNTNKPTYYITGKKVTIFIPETKLSEVTFKNYVKFFAGVESKLSSGTITLIEEDLIITNITLRRYDEKDMSTLDSGVYKTKPH